MTMSDMEMAACCIIQIIKDTPDLRNTKLAIAGDMAIRKHLPKYGQQSAGVSHLIRSWWMSGAGRPILTRDNTRNALT